VPTGGPVHFSEHDLTAFNDAALTHYRREHVGLRFPILQFDSEHAWRAAHPWNRLRFSTETETSFARMSLSLVVIVLIVSALLEKINLTAG
jgi:hypothetical protein